MALTRSEVENIAHLARLAIRPEEIPVYVNNLSRILDFVRQLEAADTRGVQPIFDPEGSNSYTLASVPSDSDELDFPPPGRPQPVDRSPKHPPASSRGRTRSGRQACANAVATSAAVAA